MMSAPEARDRERFEGRQELLPCVTLLYHFFHPDDVVSARQFSDLGVSLAATGWSVIARPCNRTWTGHNNALPPLAARERWQAVDIRRVWRPALEQASNLGRAINAVWMLAAWTLAAAFSRRHEHEAVIIGTDPVFAVLVALPWRLFRPRAKIVHWCFDVYPDAAVAEGVVAATSWPVRALSRLMAAAYRRCEFIADLGPCMARRVAETAPEVRCVTITPWALVEPENPPAPDREARAALFGDARLGLLYSGSFGRAHSHLEFLELARALRNGSTSPDANPGIVFCFAGRGHRADELRAAVTEEDVNIRFAGFAPEAELERRLTACDIHLVSLRPDWTGTVVPSKFFGALAAGRAVVFAGSPDSSIARWIREFQVGWVVTPETVAAVATELRELARAPERLQELRERCHRVYHEQFSRGRMTARWEAELRQTMGFEAAALKSTREVDALPARGSW
jgi:colanic acid biosynthesis glycosyl transferase WcaI